ncbi:ankyrin repeat-containing domain, PGG domain protein [Tanacetum coccineum]|uniref:Ankyrin repeat-containing domain, PGG domain protein n=1 Tax=Tanacetum coccineum TaxID=301880 RepID=A0ABQ5EU91_9ASTR
MVMVSPGVVRVYGGNVVRVSLTRGGIGLADVVVVARDGSLVVVFVDGSRISHDLAKNSGSEGMMHSIWLPYIWTYDVEVESMIPPYYRKRKNKDGLTPHELFTKEHKDLVEKGEEWMKGTANQCMVVAALIATVVFAAAFTVPGGYNQTNGIPIFKSKQQSYGFCSGPNAISLVSITAAIRCSYLSLKSCSAERVFLHSIYPEKVDVGSSNSFSIYDNHDNRV